MRNITLKDVLLTNHILNKFFQDNEINPTEKLIMKGVNQSIGAFYMNAAMGWLKHNEPSESLFELSIQELNTIKEDEKNFKNDIKNNKYENLIPRVHLVKDFIFINKLICDFINEHEINTDEIFYLSMDHDSIKLTDHLFTIFNIYISFLPPSIDIFDCYESDFSDMMSCLIKKKIK